MIRHHSEHSPLPRRGIVLMLTLAMIVIAVTLTARTANRSLTRTLESLDAESQLRDRWSRLSLQQAVLSHAEQIFAAVEGDQRDTPPTTWHDAEFTLAGTTYRLRLADENAKINLNTVMRTQSLDALDQFISQSTSRSLRREKRSPSSTEPTNTPPAPLESWGQVFPISTHSALLHATTKITLWGNGRLNIHRATDQSLRQLLEPLTSPTEVDALLRQSRETTAQTQPALLAAQNSLPTGPTADLLTHTSRCHSLWIRTEAESSTELHIRETLTTGARTVSFRW